MRARQKIQELQEERAQLKAKEQLSQEEQERLQQIEKEIADLTVYLMMG